MPLRYYFDLMSQPSRAVYIFLRLNNIPFEAKPVALRKGEHLGDEYKKINPFSLVPVIDDDGFKLTESIAIMKYLAKKYKIEDHWVPQDSLEKMAKLEEYLHWHHANTRMTSALLFGEILIIPKATGQPIQQKQVEKLKEKVSKMVDQLESYFLKDQPYLAGDKISIADLLGACELTQLSAVHEQELYEKSPIVKAWLERVRKETNPYFDESHKMIYRTRDVYKDIAAKL